MNTKPVPHNERPAIQNRQFTMPLDANVPRYWFDDNAASTHFMHALSCIFPGGERFFVKSVIDCLADVKDARLKREARQFCGQEAVHGQQHESLNSWGDKFGYNLTQITADEEARIFRETDHLPKIKRLATTAALEHFTAIVGHALLTTPELHERMHPAVRNIWIWHAIEEIEHKSVAHEVFEAVGGTYFDRVLAIIVAGAALMFQSTRLMVKLMRVDGKLFDLKSYIKFYRAVFSTGFAGKVWAGFKDYFRRDFHPWQLDDRQLIQEFSYQIKDNLPVKARTVNGAAV